MSEPMRMPREGESSNQAEGPAADRPATGGSTTEETRYEFGFFFRRVETTSETPPSYPNPKPDPPSG